MDTIEDKHVKNPRHNSPPMILIGNKIMAFSMFCFVSNM